jgi:hypothetical protein
MMNDRETIRHGAAADFAAPPEIDRVQRLALIVGVVGLIVTAIGIPLSLDYVRRAFLVGWMLWLGITLGCLVLSMVHHLTTGGWGLVQRRVMEAASRTLPLLAVLGVLPFVFGGLPSLYEWARPGVMEHDKVLQLKQAYLNPLFFSVRYVFYFLVWMGLAYSLSRISRRQDLGDDPGTTQRMKVIAAPGIILYALTITFAAVDWLMALQPHWSSTMYGVYMMGSHGLSGLAFLIVTGLWLSRREPMAGVIRPHHFHDYGKLLFAFVMLWAYFSYSQFLIIWAGNLPEENSFYLRRFHGVWGVISVAIALFHFLLPFLLLLSRDLKRNPRRLIFVALWLLAMRWLELVWQVEPAFDHRTPAFSWLYLAAPVGIGGLWVFWFVRELKSRPLLPVSDPYLPEVLAHE